MRWSAANAGLVGLAAATAGAIGFFGTSIYAEKGISGALIGTGAEAAFSGADIRWIILPALSLYELQQRSRAIDAIRTALMFISSTGRFQAKYAAWAIFAAFCFLLPYLVLAIWVGPELPTIGGALAGGSAFAFVVRQMHAQQAEILDVRTLAIAGLPYAVLVGLILMTRLVPQLRDALRHVVFEWALPGPFGGRIEPLYDPGTMLLAGFLLGGLLQRRKIAELSDAVAAAGRRLVPVAVALFAMLAIARLMVHAGMIEALAATAAQIGWAWPLLAPSVGALGSFITGSTTVSNILLTDLQQAAAADLGLPVLVLVSAQGFGAAIGHCVALHNIITGAATVGLQGREGDILRKTDRLVLGILRSEVLTAAMLFS